VRVPLQCGKQTADDAFGFCLLSSMAVIERRTMFLDASNLRVVRRVVPRFVNFIPSHFRLQCSARFTFLPALRPRLLDGSDRISPMCNLLGPHTFTTEPGGKHDAATKHHQPR